MADDGGDGGRKIKGPLLLRKYKIGKLLGRGSFAKVYHARSDETGQSVAIKVLNKDHIMKCGLVPHIKHEIKILRHLNIIQLFEVMATKSKFYFIMEYVRGEKHARQRDKSKVRCYDCHELGHFAAECQYKEKDDGAMIVEKIEEPSTLL